MNISANLTAPYQNMQNQPVPKKDISGSGEINEGEFFHIKDEEITEKLVELTAYEDVGNRTYFKSLSDSVDFANGNFISQLGESYEKLYKNIHENFGDDETMLNDEIGRLDEAFEAVSKRSLAQFSFDVTYKEFNDASFKRFLGNYSDLNNEIEVVLDSKSFFKHLSSAMDNTIDYIKKNGSLDGANIDEIMGADDDVLEKMNSKELEFLGKVITGNANLGDVGDYKSENSQNSGFSEKFMIGAKKAALQNDFADYARGLATVTINL